MRRLLLAWVVAGIVIGVIARPAGACSCAGILDVRATVAEVDAAFVGTLTAVGPGPRRGLSFYTFEVEQVVKGSLPGEVRVESSSSGASCGLEVLQGEPVGLLLGGQPGAWASNLCWQIEPERLLLALEPLPHPDGTDPPAFVVGGSFGAARLVLLDASGRTLAYGRGGGDTLMVSVCPGGDLAVELVQDGVRSPYLVAVRDLATMAVVRETKVTGDLVGARGTPGLDVGGVSCRDARAQEILAVVTEWPQGSGRTHLLAVGGTDPRHLVEVDAQWARFAADRVLLDHGPHAATVTALSELDLGSLEVRRIGRLPAATWQATPSPDGTMIAGVIVPEEPAPTKVFVMEAGTSPGQAMTVPVEPGSYGEIRWLDDGTFAYFPRWSSDEIVRVYDAALRLVGTVHGWSARPVVDGPFAFGMQGFSLVFAPVPGGPVTEVRDLEPLGDPEPVALVGEGAAERVAAALERSPQPQRASGAGAAVREDAATASLPWVVGTAAATVLGAAAALAVLRRLRRRSA